MDSHLGKIIKNLYWKWYNFKMLYFDAPFCENCRYFGGLMCDHIDEEGNCLGWERTGWHPIKNMAYRIRMKRLVRKMRKMRLDKNK